MSYTNIAKPTGTDYTNLNPQGLQTYDQADLTFDDANVFYDSINYAAYTDVLTPSVAWNLNRASIVGSFSVVAKTNNPEWVFFKPDGTTMFVGDGQDGENIIEYSLSTAWDVTTAVFVQEVDFSGTISDYMEGAFFNSDGTRLYALGGETPSKVHQYALSTAWDVSTATQEATFTLESYATGIFLNPDTSKMFYISNSPSNARVYEYNLSTPGDVSTARLGDTLSVSASTTTPDGLFLKPDGTRMYFVSYNGTSTVYEYTLNAPWILGTASATNSLQLYPIDRDIYASFFRSDGMRMYIPQASQDLILMCEFTGEYTNINKPT